MHCQLKTYIMNRCPTKSVINMILEEELLAQGQTQGSMLQQRTNKTLTTDPFGNTYKAGEVSPKVES